MGGFGVVAIVVGIILVIVFVVRSKVQGQASDADAQVGNIVHQAPEIQQGIEEETVAAIMAAISCMMESTSGARYAVRSISRAKSERPVWAAAGVQQNTRPF